MSIITNNPLDSIADLSFDYVHFVRRYAQLSKIFYLTQSLLLPETLISHGSQQALAELSERKERVAQDFSTENAIRSVVACSQCGGACCLGSYNHFSAIDYWLSKYGVAHNALPLQAYGIERYLPWYVHLSRNRLRLHIFPKANVLTFGCEHLGIKGCKLDFRERPIKCLVFTCKKYRQSMNSIEKKQYAQFILEVYSISIDTLAILIKEAGLPALYGKLCLLLTI